MMTDADAERIDVAALDLLEEPGILLEHDAIRDLLLAAGAREGAAAGVLRLPRELVRECIERAPAEIEIADRRGGGYTLGPDGPGRAWSVPGMHLVRHGEHRPFAAADMADAARLIDRLDEVDGCFGMSLADVPPKARDVVGLRIMAENTTKHIRVLCFTPEGADRLREMRSVVADAPWFSVGFTAHGPLRWTHLSLEIFRRTAGCGIPTTINGEPMAGVSGPVTLAGSAAVGTAEILAGLVVNQILEPGRPCIFNLGLAHTFDMRSAIAVTGGPENHLLADISAALGRYYRLPSASWVSTESMLPDGQAALEKGIGFQTHLRSGVSLLWGVGQLESELTFCPAQAVIDNEILGYARRYLRGVEVSDETLAVEVTREVGIAGDFLSEEHTLEHYRDEFFEPAVLLRRTRPNWTAAGAADLAARAEERVDALLAEERAPTLDGERSRALRRIEEAFLASVGGEAMGEEA